MTWTKQRLNNLFFVVGLAAVIAMLITFDVSFVELWHHLQRAGYWLIPIVGIWLLIYAINALAWRSVIKGNTDPDEHVSFPRLLRLTISGYALNYATPVGGLGGEPYRIMELSRNISKDHATSSVILYAMMHMVGHFCLWFSSIFLYLALWLAGDLPMNTAMAASLLFILALSTLLIYFFAKGYRHGFVSQLLRFLGKIPGLRGWSQRTYEKHKDFLEDIDRQIAALHRQDKRHFYNALALEYLSRIAQGLEVMFMLILLGETCGGGIGGYTLVFLHSVLIISFTTLFANLIGFLPMQLGIQEGGFVLSIAAMGLSAATGIFVSIIFRVREIIWIFIGILLMKKK